MIDYKETSRPIHPMLAQTFPTVPPPAPDVLYTGYTGLPGFVETLTILTITGAAAWVGIRTGLGSENPDIRARESVALRTAGWIGGVGSALIGLLYIGGKASLTNWLPLPSVRIVPA